MTETATSLLLKEVEENPQPSPYLDLIQAAKSSGSEYWQIWNLLAFRPKAAYHLARFSHEIMHEDAPISAGMRELIAAYTSSLNHCTFCMQAHAAGASQLFADEELVWSAIHNPDGSKLAENDKAILCFVRKVTEDSSNIGAADIDALHAAGWDDTAIYYAIAACALFNFYNRFVSSNGVPLVPKEVFRKLGSRMAEKGYIRD